MRLNNHLHPAIFSNAQSALQCGTPSLARLREGEGWGRAVRWCYLRLRLLLAGGSPAAAYFLLSGQEKVSKEKSAPTRYRAAPVREGRLQLLPQTGLRLTSLSCAPVRRSFGLPCAARCAGRLRNSSLSLRDKDSDSARRLPPAQLRCSAALRGGNSKPRAWIWRRVFNATLFFLVCATANAATYPERPLRFLIPFPPGGGADALARIVGAVAGESLGQQIVIDNRTGAGGNIAAEAAAKAAADGHTLLQSNISHAISASLYRQLNYDLARDFVHVTQLASIPFALALHPSLGVSNVRELVALVKAKPAQYVYASSGNGGPSHLAMEMFKTANGVDIRHVPYKGAAAIATDLVANQVQMSFFTTAGLLPLISGGRVKPLAIASARRSPLMPDLPTFAEQGMPGFEATTWFGVSLPRGSPAEAVKRLHAGFTQAL